jgi:hypothetical protein
MADYVNITLAEMRSFLEPQGFKQLESETLGFTKEAVFGKRVDADGLALSLRVYTGINPDGNSRDVGADAIRCNIFWRKSDGDVTKVASSKRVNRVQGWRDNLQHRIDSLTIDCRCDKCSAPMVLRKVKGTKREFYGCANFPNCRNTKEA